MVLMFTWDVYGDRSGQNVTLRREENGYKKMCLGRFCMYRVRQNKMYTHFYERKLYVV